MTGSSSTDMVLQRWQRAVYGLPYIGYSIATLPVVAFVPAFYASERGLALGAVGLMIALTRLTDAATDPLVGWFSDRLRTSIGRRKPVILAGLPLFCVSVWMLFVPPDDVSLSYVFIWAALLYFSFTLIDLPFKSFGAELSPRYDERAELAGWREGLGLFGTLLGLAAAAYVVVNGGGSLGDQMFVLAVIALISTPLLFFVTLGVLREPPPEDAVARDMPLAAKVRLIWRNGPYRLLLIICFLLLASEFGSGALKALVLEHVYGNQDLFPILLLTELIVTVLFIPFWLWMSQRYSKHQAVAVAVIWGGVLSLILPFLASGSLTIFFALSVLKATAVGAILVLVNGMAADVVDIDMARTGEARTGIYFSLWGMVNKGAVALGILVATNLPGLLGYQVSDTGVEGAWTLLWTLGLLPAVGFFSTVPILMSWRLTRERQSRIRAAIDRRTARRLEQSETA